MDSFWFLFRDLKNVVFSVAPLLIVLLILKILVFRTPLESAWQFGVGSVFTIFGLFLFLQGAQMSLIPAATSVGTDLVRFGRPIILIITCCVGFVATLVEPALSEVAKEAEITSVGAITQGFLMVVTACGFSIGMFLGIMKIIYNIPFMSVLIPVLAVLVVLGYFCNQTFAAIAFDCAGATTGPVNIPVNMALALGLANSIAGVDPLTAGFGIVGLNVLGVAAAIMAVGIIKGI